MNTFRILKEMDWNFVFLRQIYKFIIQRIFRCDHGSEEEEVPDTENPASESNNERQTVTSYHLENENQEAGQPQPSTGRTVVQLESVSGPLHAAHLTLDEKTGANGTSGETITEPEPEVSLSRSFLLGIGSEEEIARLSVGVLRKLLTEFSVSFESCFEKQDLVDKLSRLWKDLRNEAACGQVIPEADRCRICMDARIDCTFLECGHMATCNECGRQMKDCPVCRMYITRVVRVYRA